MMLDDNFKKSEAELLALWDKKQSLQITIEDLEAELKEFILIQQNSKTKSERLQRSIEGLRDRIERDKKRLYNI
ncbi:hypothetical protein G9F31_15595 [Acinetobacter sp. 187]|uniref:hypothetical protein n=1 Tax=Acinetobacter lanii TaxID=2715163 RepID=UPI00140C7474|nr:hypothetical protein [Acinetobacter lanii]NHC05142.1 hypothetical protein [Acinetobacter lanii]